MIFPRTRPNPWRYFRHARKKIFAKVNVENSSTGVAWDYFEELDISEQKFVHNLFTNEIWAMSYSCKLIRVKFITTNSVHQGMGRLSVGLEWNVFGSDIQLLFNINCLNKEVGLWTLCHHRDNRIQFWWRRRNGTIAMQRIADRNTVNYQSRLLR